MVAALKDAQDQMTERPAPKVERSPVGRLHHDSLLSKETLYRFNELIWNHDYQGRAEANNKRQEQKHRLSGFAATD